MSDAGLLLVLSTRHGGSVCGWLAQLVRGGHSPSTCRVGKPLAWLGFMFNEDRNAAREMRRVRSEPPSACFVLSFLYFARVFCVVWPLLFFFLFFQFSIQKMRFYVLRFSPAFLLPPPWIFFFFIPSIISRTRRRKFAKLELLSLTLIFLIYSLIISFKFSV